MPRTEKKTVPRGEAEGEAHGGVAALAVTVEGVAAAGESERVTGKRVIGEARGGGTVPTATVAEEE